MIKQALSVFLTGTMILLSTSAISGAGNGGNGGDSGGAAMNSPFTHGNVQLTLKKGVTTQTDVLETFGAPNMATIDSAGNEVWTYQKNATVSTSKDTSTFGTVLIAGAKTSTSGFEQSSRAMTMIIKFDATKKVIDFKSMTTSF